MIAFSASTEPSLADARVAVLETVAVSVAITGSAHISMARNSKHDCRPSVTSLRVCDIVQVLHTLPLA
ncbi:hypothetical protein MHK13_08580 [Corynebacterium hadale]|uniref:hypothetical protein n=1 Tax=Corynebacterium hadale TaxID=2026255 RepID=UPI001EF1D388|nr:hypothetical protein [Corynebacterium hadale]MCG7254785.1 hypothetical protein [Corynebacterium hadale]MCG7257011.1 hypothetical protein [Corynebacterium hadale]MCG7265665.1 hypothetical protein [Corynebacterium hadale]